MPRRSVVKIPIRFTVPSWLDEIGQPTASAIALVAAGIVLEMAFVFAAELGGAVIAHQGGGFGNAAAFTLDQLPCPVEADLLHVLQR